MRHWSSRRCCHVKEDGKRCRARAAPGHEKCYAHCPEIQEPIKNEAFAKFRAGMVEYELKCYRDQTKCGIALKQAVQERDAMLAKVGELARWLEAMKEVVAKVTDISRLEEIYQTAKAAGDAATMAYANKSSYYAAKRLTRTMEVKTNWYDAFVGRCSQRIWGDIGAGGRE